MLAKSLKKAEFDKILPAANGDQKTLFSAFNRLVDGKQDVTSNFRNSTSCFLNLRERYPSVHHRPLSGGRWWWF